MIWNLPNKVTLARLPLAVLFFVLVSYDRPTVLDAALTVFIIACFTDYLDGYLARRLNLATAFGRIADPLVDKIIICGGFVLFVGRTPVVQGWMIVVLIGREFLVNSVRGYAESRGVAFGAEMAGKVKAVIQMVALGLVVCFHAHGRLWLLAPDVSRALTLAAVYLALLVTVLSAFAYIVKARRVFAPGQQEDS